jgi:hemerythrin-like domain-containing protein
MQDSDSRRRFLAALTAFGTGAVLLPAARGAENEAKEEKEEDVSPGEDLMREHGVLNRVLLVYEECMGRLTAPKELDPKIVVDAADIVRNFVEEYHEKIEEQHLFPRFRKAGVLVELVDVLQRQHDAGRAVTDRIKGLATPEAVRNPEDSRNLAEAMGQFVRTYRPHEAREDTVLFPALHGIVTPDEYKEMGEQFEEEEHKRFGKGGFEEFVDKVAQLEKSLGIYELAQFTPKT